MNNYPIGRPVATLSNNKITLDIPFLPAKLGRNDRAVDLYLMHETVSREHCLFECIDHMYTIRDLGSTAGTFVNGVQIEPNVPYRLDDGSKLRFGKIKMEFNADYEALQMFERAKADAARREAAAREQARREAAAAPRDRRVTVTARELTDYEYDESEVVFIDCGLAAGSRPMSYTTRLKKSELEAAQAAAAAEAEEAEEAEEEAAVAEGYAALQEAAEEFEDEDSEEYEEDDEEYEEDDDEEYEEEDEEEEESASVDVRNTFVMDPAELEKAGKEAVPEEAGGDAGVSGALRLSWIDDITGDTKRLSIEEFPFYIGRNSEESDYTIRKKGMSRRHFCLEKSDGRFWVRDDNSTNGVRLNGTKLPEGGRAMIESGDRIRAAGITFTVRIDK